MPEEVTRTIASVGSWITGSGTSSTRTSRLPCQVTAFIPPPATRRGGPETESGGPSGPRRGRERLELARDVGAGGLVGDLGHAGLFEARELLSPALARQGQPEALEQVALHERA